MHLANLTECYITGQSNPMTTFASPLVCSDFCEWPLHVCIISYSDYLLVGGISTKLYLQHCFILIHYLTKLPKLDSNLRRCCCIWHFVPCLCHGPPLVPITLLSTSDQVKESMPPKQKQKGSAISFPLCCCCISETFWKSNWGSFYLNRILYFLGQKTWDIVDKQSASITCQEIHRCSMKPRHTIHSLVLFGDLAFSSLETKEIIF